jgi:phosphoribosylamine---glycine ligase
LKVAVIGKGGREAAIAWKLSQSENLDQVVVYPGNPGMLASKVTCEDFANTVELVSKLSKYDYVVVGQEKYLEEGIIDTLIQKKIPCVGPIKAASRLESSKLFCKQVFTAADVPTAEYKHFSNYQDLVSYTTREIQSRSLVLKWDYLAEGKGVYVCFSNACLQNAFRELKSLGEKQNTFSVLVEDCLMGREFSAFCLVDNDSIQYFSSACDYKRLSAERDSPNTGGMGTYSPADVLKINEKEIIMQYTERIVKQLAQQRIQYNGVMFLGCMQVGAVTYLLEINTRLGDPETQSILPRLITDLSDVFNAMSKRQGLLKNINMIWSDQNAVHVVKADPNYPTSRRQHVKIETQPTDEVTVFFAGVEKRADGLYTNGGRVLGITALAPNKEQACQKVYNNIMAAHFENEYFREDIGC